jgi:hypothetical protein
LALIPAAAILAPAAAADSPASNAPAPPYIDHARWVSYGGLPTLRIYPTSAGRAVAGEFGKLATETGEAWHEVLAMTPDADTPGMRAQFLCHWNFAEFAQPGKTSWDLEPWRPAVDDNTMLLTGCNPGGAEKG